MHIDIFYTLMIFLAALLAVLSLTLFLIRLIRYMLNKRRLFVEEKTIRFIQKVTNLIPGPEYDKNWLSSGKRLINEFRKKYVDRFNFDRYIVTDLLLTLHRGIKSTAAERVRDAYIDLGLNKKAIKSLEGNKTFYHAKIIRELAQMRIVEAEPAIRKVLKTGNEEVRLEASVALLTLHLDNPEVELAHLSQMTLWQKIYIIETCKNLRSDIVPDFTGGFASANKHVVEICLILCEYFKQSYSTEVVKKLLFSSEANIRYAAGFLSFKSNNRDLIRELIEKLPLITDIKRQIAVVKQLKLMDDPDLITDLSLVIDHPSIPDEVRLEAIRSACRLSEKYNQIFNLNQIKNPDEKIHNMYKHAIEKLI